jgi:hypothetical protein
VLEQVVRIATTVRGECVKACDSEGNLFLDAGVVWFEAVQFRD